MTMRRLEIDRLNVQIGDVHPVRDVSLAIEPGQIFGIAGESGSGKSMTALAVMGLLPGGADRTGAARLDGQDLFALDEAAMCGVRGQRIGMIFQEPMTALNPVRTIGSQVAETLIIHQGMSRADAAEIAAAKLDRVGLAAGRVGLDRYPHELSGGQRQRVMIAQAIALQPALLIADEPTTALDVTIQGQVIHEMQKLCKKTKTALLWITHDLAVVAGISSRICVMYAGRIVEQGPNEALIGSPMHPYTNGLLGSVPSQNRRGEPLQQIEGIVPSLLDLPPGCAFENRCNHAVATCRQSAPEEMVMADQRILRCFNRVEQGQT